jgi:murein L,D-transpeptidase YafK
MFSPQNVAIAKFYKRFREFQEGSMRVIIQKGERRLYLMDGDQAVLSAPIALGRASAGAKAREGDGKTPEGTYRICLTKPDGKHGRSLGLNYPNAADARAALVTKAIDENTYRAIAGAEAQRRRPPWGTVLGGEIYIHEGGADGDWTQGCVALNESDMDVLFPHYPEITQVVILP